MGQINIHNYEAYLLDFSEGNLMEELQMELELFLIQHPELDINLSELELVSLNEETILFENKQHLKKSNTDLVSEAQFVAYIEDQLSENEKQQIEKSCAVNAQLAKELALFQKTIAVTDTTIIYPNKSELKRKPKVIWFDFSVAQYAAAACILFLIGLFVFWPKTETLNNSNLASNSKSKNQQDFIIKHQPEVATLQNQQQTIVKNSNQKTIRPSYSVSNQSNNVLLAEKESVNNTVPNVATKQDSMANKTIIQSPITNSSESLIALNNPTIKKQNNVIVQVITESDEDLVGVVPEKKKKGIWAAASRALKNLNHAGVKSVNGNEDDVKGEASYALTLGGMSITHKAGL